MKKLLSITALTLAGISNLSAYNWTVTNGTTTHKCVTVNASGQRIRQDIEPGETKVFGFGGWKSGLCLTSVAVKDFAEGCPAGLVDIAKADIRTLAGPAFDGLISAVESAAISGISAAASGAPAATAASGTTQTAEQAVSSVTQTAMKTAATAPSSQSPATQGLIAAGIQAIKSSFGLISKLCKGGQFVIVEEDAKDAKGETIIDKNDQPVKNVQVLLRAQ